MPLVHQDRIDAGVSFDWDTLPAHCPTLAELAHDAQDLRFRRERSSQRGISRFKNLRRLWLYSVNQDFLDELSCLPDVEVLFLHGLTATDPTPLTRLRRLRRLIIAGGTKVQSLDWVTQLPPLEAFAIENFKRVFRLDPVSSLTSLTALGIEGSIWTRMRVATLSPLSQLRHLRHLFLTNMTAADRRLKPLHSLTALEVLQIGALFPDEELLRLRDALPGLRCDWFGMIDRHGSTREGIRVAVDGR
jgi:hypothetical protein